MAEYSRLASGQITTNGQQVAVMLPFIPNFIEISNKTSAQNGSGIYRAWWETDMGQGSAFLESVSTGSGGSYGYVYALTPQSVAAYTTLGTGEVIFDAAGPLNGVTWVSGRDITVVKAGTYNVTFQVSGTEPNQFAIFVNDVPQQSTVGGSGAGTQQNSISSILTLPAGAVINLVNYVTAGAVTLASTVGGTQPNVTANVTISQVGAGGGDAVGYIDAIGGTSSAGLVNGTGFTTIQAGLALQYGPTVFLGASGGITKAAAGVVTTSSAHNLTTGNWVTFQNLYQISTTGMQQIAGVPFMVTVLSPTTFSIPWNTNQSNYTAIATGGLNTLASYKQILYPVLYAPQVSYISAITLGTTTTVVTTAPHNLFVGQEVAFRIPSIYGTTQLNSLPNLLIPGSPVYGYVTSVTNSTTFVVNINSTAFTAFNSNQPFLSFPGLEFAQVLSVGDVNTGGFPLSTTSQLYPSPTVFNGFSSSTTVGVNTINGPAIQGAFFNSTFMGFIIGSGVVGGNADVPNTLYWRAYMHDINT